MPLPIQDFTLHDLHETSALETLDARFLAFLKKHSAELASHLTKARQSHPTTQAESALLLDLAPYVEDFIGAYFGIEENLQALQNTTNHFAPLYRCKRLFVQRQAAKTFSREEALCFDGATLKQKISMYLEEDYSDLAFARFVVKALEDKTTHQTFLDLALPYAAWALHQKTPSLLFRLPRKMDPEALFPVNREGDMLTSPHLVYREGFDCTTPSIQPEESLDQTHYCVLCHNQGKDSCSKGLPGKANGCPLEQKISEMNALRSRGHVLGALAVIMIDNPMVAATGNRICNDCEKACIFQKQEAVNVPNIESEILESVLNLPWGVEIYSLLSRWNPLNFQRPFPKPLTEHKVLIAGMGPAGFTLAHYLLNEGHQVVGIDKFTIEPLPSHLLTQPIRNWSDLKAPLSQRTIGGFGGVMEYGITARWDKNYLDLLRLLLERRSHFTLQDQTRLGKEITLSQAFEQGFDHVALCLGAGWSNTLSLPHEKVKGIIPAARFLVDLQLKGAAQEHSKVNLQIRLPILVIGGGLTAVDTATETLAYYAFQVEKFANSPQDKAVTQEFADHAHALHQGDRQFLQEAATIVYRRTLQQSPAYRLNHKELQLAMAEGVRFLENATPLEIRTDATGHIEGLVVQTPRGVESLPCRTLLVATGTQAPTFLEEEGLVAAGDIFLSYQGETKVSFFGDLNPLYEGNVVRAMASAKNGYSQICAALLGRTRGVKNISSPRA